MSTLDIYGIEDVIDGCAYLVFLNELYEYIAHNTKGEMIFRNVNHNEQAIIISYKELCRHRDVFKIAY